MNTFLNAALALALSACAPLVAAGSLADLSVVDRATGQRLPTYYHQGRHWIAGTPGNKYAVAVCNRSGQRVMAVVSVDGVNVVTGETAAPDQNGYVLAGGMDYEITGWRKSTDEVAPFVFTALPDSYAARTGRPGNVGVIGMAVFREWAPPRPAAGIPRPYSHADALASKAESDGAAQRNDGPAAAAGEAARAPRDERLGTGHGEREGSRVGYTTFRRAGDRPGEMITIHYDSYANLVARGVIPFRPKSLPTPNPFPAGMRFVPDPQG